MPPSTPTPAQPGIFPEGRLHHLVLAACGEGDTSTAWQAYADALDNDYPNEGELRIFPLIAERLGGDLTALPLGKFLHSTRRWARMQAMINRELAGQIGQLFKAENIPLMWTKGSALVARTDQRPELRPSSDLDGLIRWEDMARIEAVSVAQGWKPKLGLMKNRQRARFANTELSFEIGARGKLDLQWQPRLPFAYDTKIQPWLWEDAGRAQDKTGTPYASDTWLMLETIEHGLNSNPVYPIRWVVDAVRLLQYRHDNIDWAMIVNIAQRTKVHYSVAAGLKIIAKYSPHIPDTVIAELDNIRVSYLDKEEFKVRVCSRDLASGYYNLRALTQLRREPSKLYFKAPPSPLSRRSTLSGRARTAIAGRNIYTRLVFPLWYL